MELIYNQWCIDMSAFPRTSAGIIAALKRQGVPWSVFEGDVRYVPPEAFFWGSLSDAYGQAAPWGYIGHGDADNFRCSVYRDKWSHFFKGRAGASFSTVKDGVPRLLMQHEQRLFCRPDSPLKPFAGRIVDVSTFCPQTVDVGYYYDDLSLPILFEPVVTVGREWRFVVVDGFSSVAGCQYAGSRVRDDAAVALDNAAIQLVYDVARDPWQPARAYVVDVAEMNGVVSLLEINPISGADFYECNPDAIVRHITGMEE